MCRLYFIKGKWEHSGTQERRFFLIPNRRYSIPLPLNQCHRYKSSQLCRRRVAIIKSACVATLHSHECQIRLMAYYTRSIAEKSSSHIHHPPPPPKNLSQNALFKRCYVPLLANPEAVKLDFLTGRDGREATMERRELYNGLIKYAVRHDGVLLRVPGPSTIPSNLVYCSGQTMRDNEWSPHQGPATHRACRP